MRSHLLIIPALLIGGALVSAHQGAAPDDKEFTAEKGDFTPKPDGSGIIGVS